MGSVGTSRARADPLILSRWTPTEKIRGGRTLSVFPSCREKSLPLAGAELVGELMPKPAGALKELHREHEVAERLLERLVELGDRVKSGERVDAKAVRFGVGLLDAYLHRVHASQMDRELRPEAQGVAMPGCLEQLDRMRTNHEQMRARAQELLALIGRWASGDESCRGAVGDKLIDLASRDHDAATYEEAYPLICLESALPEDAENRLSNRFSDHAGTRAALEANIERFLSETVAI